MINQNQIYCETCGQPIKNYKTTLTKRNLIWIWTLGKIGKEKYGEEGYWVNYKEVHELVAKNFGKVVDNKWRPMVLSNYGLMGGNPWKLIETHDSHKEKFKKRGDWRLTETGILFINNKIQLPEIGWFSHDGCYKSSRPIYAHEIKGINFDELTDFFNSF